MKARSLRRGANLSDKCSITHVGKIIWLSEITEVRQ